MVDHYANAADIELAAFDAAVTDWELLPRIREAVTQCAWSTSTVLAATRRHAPSSNPADRPSRRRGADVASAAETDAAIEARPRAPSRPGGPSRRASGPGCCAGSPPSSTSTSTSWPRSRSRNSGHTIGNARWEAGNVRDVLNYYSAAPERLFGRQIPVAGGVDVTFHEPLGVVGVIVPWNFPMPIAGWGFAPALAAGNTVVLKPAELTPLTAIRLAELALEAGLPEGVFTVIPGKGSVVGERFVTHPLVRKVCFTGSTEVGKQIMAGCADQVKRVTLELGGKSANIVFADADLEKAAASAPVAVFDNAGQDCCARSRILVQRSVYDAFLELLEPAVQRRSGSSDPADRTAEMGPLISAGAAGVGRVATSTAPTSPSRAVGAGRAAASGSRRPCVLPRRPARPDLARGDLRAGRRRAAVRRRGRRDRDWPTTPTYGLSGSIWTRDVGRALRVARGVEAGNLSRQLALVGALLDAVRRVQAVRPGPGARPGRAARVHRGEERLHRDRRRD